MLGEVTVFFSLGAAVASAIVFIFFLYLLTLLGIYFVGVIIAAYYTISSFFIKM